jgi:hypothetical protein
MLIEVAPAPEAMEAGEKTAVAPVGSPVTAKVTGELKLPPCGCNEKLKVAVWPGLTYSVVAPVDWRVKSVIRGGVTETTKTLLVIAGLRASPP